MKRERNNPCLQLAVKWIGLILTLVIPALPLRTLAVGTWTPLNNTAPGSIGLMLLLSDGTVLCAENPDDIFGDIGHNWFRLTPDGHGSYINGTWTTMNAAIDNRLFYASDVLRDGRVFVAGGEYGSGRAKAEIFDPVANSWTAVNPPASLLDPTQHSPALAATDSSGNQGFIDSISVVVADGKVLVAPVGPNVWGGTLLYDPVSNVWSAGPANLNSAYQDEASWVKLPDDSILTIDPYGQQSERYIPSLNQWVEDANVPVAMYDSGGELGAAFLLPDGRAFYLGGTGHTVFYTPSPLGGMNKGSWVQGPDIPSDGQGNPLVAQDAPAAMMVNGKILCSLGHNENNTTGGGSPPPAYFFEYDPVANSWTPAPAPGNSTPGSTDSCSTYQSTMVDLPDGTVLYCHFQQFNLGYQAYGDQLYVYTPDGIPLESGKPIITSITQNTDGSYHLEGTGLNGISQGAAFGDDAQMDSNYPLVRLNDASGDVYYAKTYNWSRTSVHTGSAIVTTEFMPPAFLPPGNYSLMVVANGIGSDPVSFTGAVWVDFNYTFFLQFGTFTFPYATLAQGISAVPNYGLITLKPGISSETMTISKPMNISAIGGGATIGKQ
jgi:hypothetical protein